MRYCSELLIIDANVGTETESQKDENENCIISDDPEELANIVARRLARIFISTHKEKIRNELDKIRGCLK
jgi:hypothetical protein